MLQASVVEGLPLGLLQTLCLLGAVVASLAVLRRLGDGRLGDPLRRRFVLGVPWGTLLTVLGVLLVYWVLQGGWANPNDPVTVAFRSWSYFYPLGSLLAGFAHNGVGHVTGNLLSTVVFAPVVEYVVGHYPRDRGTESFSSLRTNPFARVLALPVASVGVGLFTGLFSLGPVIGFSGVVFAYEGFVLATRPLLGVVALVGNQVVRLLYRSLRTPFLTREARPAFITPWWSNIAVQGHIVGLLLGAILGIAYLRRRRGASPSPLALWVGALLFGVAENVWALYAPLGANRFGLFRGVGLALVFGFAALVAAAVTASDRPLSARVSLPRRRAAIRVVALLLVVASAAAVPFGFTAVSGDLPEDAERVEIRDYTVTYVENVPNQYVPAYDISLSLFGRTFELDTQQASGVRSSGVVVFSERRRAWIEAVSRGRLAFRGSAEVWVGGVGWRERVTASRRGWSLQGNGTVYKVFLREEGAAPQLAYRTDPVRAAPTIAGRNVSIRPENRGFSVSVTRGNETLGTAPLPDAGNETRVGGLLLNRTGRSLTAIRNDTRVQVAQREVPRARQDE